jgi:protein-L-isoaspartate(D-aspartate) O-methyltransferase
MSVRRADFLPEHLKRFGESFDPIPIGDGVTVPTADLTILEADLLDLQPMDRLLEIGTGSGYQTAVWAKLCAEVVSVEVGDISDINPGLADSDHRILPDTVTVYSGMDGRYQPVNEGQFDAIVVTAGATQIYPFWNEILYEGGRLVVPMRVDGGECEIRKYIKRGGELEDQGPFAYLPVVPTLR